tara:strand:+ start:26243 stop:26797 length:555 start_codon:yes stop_codon:yes gene_type:complete
MIKQLTNLASHLDAKGLRKEADCLDNIINKLAAERGEDYPFEYPQEYLDEWAKDPQPPGADMEFISQKAPRDPPGHRDLRGVDNWEAEGAMLVANNMMEEHFAMVDSDSSGELSKEEYMPKFISMIDNLSKYLMEELGLSEKGAYAKIDEMLDLREKPSHEVPSGDTGQLMDQLMERGSYFEKI